MKKQKIANVRTLVESRRFFDPDKHFAVGPQGAMAIAINNARNEDIFVGRDGRCYVPFLRSTPRLPDGTHGRWQGGKIVARA